MGERYVGRRLGRERPWTMAARSAAVGSGEWGGTARPRDDSTSEHPLPTTRYDAPLLAAHYHLQGVVVALVVPPPPPPPTKLPLLGLWRRKMIRPPQPF